MSRSFLLVGVGLGAIGAGSLVLLAIASRALQADDFASFGVWFGFVNLVAFGLFSPLETAVSRTMLATGGLTWLMKRQALVYGSVVVVSILVLGVLLQSIVVARLMNGSWALMAVTMVYVVVLGVQAFERGVAVGYSEYRPLFWQFTTDGVLRVVLPLVAVRYGGSSTLVFASCVAVAATVGVLGGFVAIKSRTGQDLKRLDIGIDRRALAVLILAAFGAQVLMNGAPPVLSLAGNDDVRTMAALVGALTLTRIPLLFTSAIQAPLLPPMVAMIARGDTRGLWVLIRRLLIGLGIAAILAAILGWQIGEAVLRTYLGTDNVASPLALALLASSGVALLTTLAVQAALIAAASHRALANAWLIGVAIFAITISYNASAIAVAPLAIALGTTATLITMLIGLRVTLRGSQTDMNIRGTSRAGRPTQRRTRRPF